MDFEKVKSAIVAGMEEAMGQFITSVQSESDEQVIESLRGQLDLIGYDLLEWKRVGDEFRMKVMPQQVVIEFTIQEPD